MQKDDSIKCSNFIIECKTHGLICPELQHLPKIVYKGVDAHLFRLRTSKKHVEQNFPAAHGFEIICHRGQLSSLFLLARKNLSF